MNNFDRELQAINREILALKEAKSKRSSSLEVFTLRVNVEIELNTMEGGYATTGWTNYVRFNEATESIACVAVDTEDVGEYRYVFRLSQENRLYPPQLYVWYEVISYNASDITTVSGGGTVKKTIPLVITGTARYS